ncbi:MAG TPA: ComF family protein [Acidiferrobacteraceae bacterium]|nr:ComF family protein [Acidiferrobacteraceae bacterium]
MVYKWLFFAHCQLFPSRCLACGAPCGHEDWCVPCRDRLPWITDNRCPRCAAHHTGHGLCGQCQTHLPAFTICVPALAYHPPVNQYIKALKYCGQLLYGRLCGELLAEAIQTHFDRASATRPECLIPVPLHPYRLCRRGFNQALEIAKPVARRFGLPIDYRCLKRIRATRAQAHLALKERAGNVKGAFLVHQQPSYKRVALIDDVMTTGHTANEIARCLNRAGVEEIEVWVVARADKK